LEFFPMDFALLPPAAAASFVLLPPVRARRRG
jgi:hypothetical protein